VRELIEDRTTALSSLISLPPYLAWQEELPSYLKEDTATLPAVPSGRVAAPGAAAAVDEFGLPGEQREGARTLAQRGIAHLAPSFCAA
jgi:hypothetical protein